MENRVRPHLVATRVTRPERALIEAAAALEGMTVTDLLRGIVLPAVASRVTRAAGEVGESRPEAA
jgi:uncharacterized protein (DUF1778 family)